MKHINTITLCRDDYNNQRIFENEIKKAVMLLLNAGCVMVIRYDEPGLGIICIEYGPANQSLSCDYPHWLSPEELESVVFDEEIEDE